jgi:AcrR family transcriptional regulator
VPRAGLTTVRVVEEAEVLADECGLENLTLSALAPRLGVQIPSLYKHVDGMAGLQRLIAIRAKSELADLLARAAAGKAGAEAVAAMAHAYRTWAKEHPGRYPAVLRAPAEGDAEDLEASEAALTILRASLSAFDLEPEDEIDAIRLLRAHLHGFVSIELVEGMKLPQDIEHTFDLLIGGYVQTLAEWPPEVVSR